MLGAHTHTLSGGKDVINLSQDSPPQSLQLLTWPFLPSLLCLLRRRQLGAENWRPFKESEASFGKRKQISKSHNNKSSLTWHRVTLQNHGGRTLQKIPKIKILQFPRGGNFTCVSFLNMQSIFLTHCMMITTTTTLKLKSNN